MIIIDGRESSVCTANLASLEEVLTKVIEAESLDSRIITDVYVNNEAFSELYPHQAEDIEASEIQRLELCTVSVEEMASNVVVELPKVIDLMSAGSRKIADLLRRAELAEGLEMLQDLVNMNRDFLATVQVLRFRFASKACPQLDRLGDSIGDLLGEIAEVMGNEDWVLVADLLEYEFIPACEGWRAVILSLAGDVAAEQVA